MSVNVMSYPAVNEQCHNISWTTVCKVNLHLWSNDHCSDSNSWSRFKTVKCPNSRGLNLESYGRQNLGEIIFSLCKDAHFHSNKIRARDTLPDFV